MAGNATFPRIPGIEAAGVLASAPGGELAEGSQVVPMMGGMGREFDGGYAEYVTAPATAYFTGMLSDSWTIPDFYPMDYIPNGVRLTAYHGEASDLPPAALQTFLDDVAVGRARVPIGRSYDLTEIVQAHLDLEANVHPGKLVVLVPAT